MKPNSVAARRRWRVTAWVVGPCVAIALLGAGMLSATPPSVDLPPDAGTLKPSPGSPPPSFFGLTHLGTQHVARLYFANPKLPGAGPDGPATVRLEFLDGLGNVLLRNGPEVVMPGQMTSLDLVAQDLNYPPGSNEIGVRGLVTFYNPQAKGLSSLQVEDTSTNSSLIVLDRVVRSPYLVRKLDPLCTQPIKLPEGSLMRVNLTNAGDRGFPDARLSATLVIYRLRPGQQSLVRKAVQLDPAQSDSLTLEPAGGGGELFGTVEFKDSASRAIAAATYEYREGANGSPKAYSMAGCGGPHDGSSTSGGGGTNSGGAG